MALFGVSGAVGDGIADDTAAIQVALDYVSDEFGRGEVMLPKGTFLSGPLTIPDGVVLCGAGIGATTLKLKNSTNADFIKSVNFATLTGSNDWLHSDGVPTFFGLKNIQIDGNKANQASGDGGVKFYGKGIIFENVLIRDTEGVGLYTEGANIPGQTDWYDLPEGKCESLHIRNCGSHGWTMKGPHDFNVSSVFINGCGGDGLQLLTDGATYLASCDIGFAHIYANTGYGIYANSIFRARQVISESNYKEGLYLDGVFDAQISSCQLYINCRTSGSYQGIITGGAGNTIGDLHVKAAEDAGVGGFQVSSDHNRILSARVDGVCSDGATESTGVGIDLPSGADFNFVRASITRFRGVGAIGLRTGNGGANSYNTIETTISDCTTLWNHVTAGVGNKYCNRGLGASGQTIFTGVAAATATNGAIEHWDCFFKDNAGNVYKTNPRRQSGGDIDMTSTALQELTIAHECLVTPRPEDCTVELLYTGSDTSWVVGRMPYVTATSSTVVTVRLQLSTPAATGTAKLLLTVKI